MIKIIGGQARGIILDTPKSLDVRPTGIRAKKALFDSLESSIGFQGKTIVDIFSGTGSLGLEAASRGAAKVYLIEKSPKHCQFAKNNIEKVLKAGVEAEIEIIKADALYTSQRLYSIEEEVDLIFADPPYAKFAFFFSKILQDKSFALWGKNSTIIWEQPPRFHPKEFEESILWEISSIKQFAKTSFIFMHPK